MLRLLISFLFLVLGQTGFAYRPVSDSRMQELLKEFDYTPNVQLV